MNDWVDWTIFAIAAAAVGHFWVRPWLETGVWTGPTLAVISYLAWGVWRKMQSPRKS